ncbi:unnamed protein product [Symbiodinium sp. CCMP2592]|nr:unnamed protein product [Symbiodinium sp. CCMP2592]
MPLLDSPLLYPAPKVQWYTPTPRKPSHENPLGIVFPEDAERETIVSGAQRVREGSSQEDVLIVKIDGALDLLPSDNFGPHYYCATAYYPGEGSAQIHARKTEFAVGKANPAHPDLDNCMLQKTVLVPYNRKQQLLMVEIHEVDPEDSEVEDSLIGQATLPLADPKIESSTNWPLFRGFESSGSLTLQVNIPQGNSASPKTLDSATPSVCKRSRRSNTPPKGFPEPVSPLSQTAPYRCKRSERSDTPPEGFPEPVSPSRVAHPTLLESLRHGQQTPEEKKCKAFDKEWTQDIGSSKIFTGCTPCDVFLESMRKGPDLMEHSPLLKSLMSGVDPPAHVNIRLPTQAGGNLQSCIRPDQAQTASAVSGNVQRTPASYVPERLHQSHAPPRTSYNPVPMQQSLLSTSNPSQTLQYRQASYMPQLVYDIEVPFVRYDSPSFSSSMPLLDSPVLYPAPKVQWYTPTPRKPSHENPLGIVFPEDAEKETMVTGAQRVSQGSPPEDVMIVKIDGALDLLPSDNFGPHYYCATAYYPGEGNAQVHARKTEFAVGKANPAHPDLDNCMLQKTVVVPYNRKQQLLMVGIHEVDPEDSEVEDSLIGQATLPLADPKIESSTNWPLFRGFECSGSLTVQVNIPQVNSASPKTLDCATPSVCKRSNRSNTPPKGFPEPASPLSRTAPYMRKRSDRSDTPPEGFPEPISPSRRAHPTLLESLRHVTQTSEEKKCKAFDEDTQTKDIGSSKIFTGCAPCDVFLESMRKGPDLLEHSPLLKSLMSGVDPLVDPDIRLPTQAGGNHLRSCIRADQAQPASAISGNVQRTPASCMPARPHQSHVPPRTSYNPVPLQPLQQPLLGTSNPPQTLQYRQASYMPQFAGYSTVGILPVPRPIVVRTYQAPDEALKRRSALSAGWLIKRYLRWTTLVGAFATHMRRVYGIEIPFVRYDSPSFSSSMPLLDSPVLYPAPKVQWYTPTPRKPSHENPFGIVFPEDAEKETMVTGAHHVREEAPPEHLMVVKIDGALDLLPSDNFGPHFYCATAYYPGESSAEINYLCITLAWVVCCGAVALQVHIPQGNSASPKALDSATPSVCKRSRRSNTPPKGFPEPVSPLSQTAPYRCKRSQRSDTLPEGFPEPVSPFSVAHPIFLETLRHGQQTPEVICVEHEVTDQEDVLKPVLEIDHLGGGLCYTGDLHLVLLCLTRGSHSIKRFENPTCALQTVQWYTPTPRKPSHENPLGIVFPEDAEKETKARRAQRVREGSSPEDVMLVKIDGALDLLPSDNFGPHYYCATAYYPGEGNEQIHARKTEFAVGKANPAHPDLDNCMLQKTVVVPYNRKQQLLMVEIHEVDPEDSEVEDSLIGQATLPLADPKIESSTNWPLFRGFESSGSLAVQVHIPQVNSASPKMLDCATPSVCKRSRRSNTPPKGFPEPVSPLSRTAPYMRKRSERSDTPPEGFPEPLSPSRVAHPTLLESGRHGKQTPDEKKCKAFDEDMRTKGIGSSKIFTGCASCDVFLESMRKGPDLLQHSPLLKSLMSGVDPLADVDICRPTQAGGNQLQSCIRPDQAQTASAVSGNVQRTPASYVPARPHQSHAPPCTSYNPVPMQQSLLGTSNPPQTLQYRQASYMPQVVGYSISANQTSTYHVQHRQANYMPQAAGDVHAADSHAKLQTIHYAAIVRWHSQANTDVGILPVPHPFAITAYQAPVFAGRSPLTSGCAQCLEVINK